MAKYICDMKWKCITKYEITDMDNDNLSNRKLYMYDVIV